MAENKQLELSKHLKEISQRNDQVLHVSGYLPYVLDVLYKNFL